MPGLPHDYYLLENPKKSKKQHNLYIALIRKNIFVFLGRGVLKQLRDDHEARTPPLVQVKKDVREWVGTTARSTPLWSVYSVVVLFYIPKIPLFELLWPLHSA